MWRVGCAEACPSLSRYEWTQPETLPLYQGTYQRAALPHEDIRVSETFRNPNLSGLDSEYLAEMGKTRTKNALWKAGEARGELSNQS